MSTQLQICVTEKNDCESFYFQDVTPLLNTITTPGGYDLTGVTNLNPNDINQSRMFLDVTIPDGTIISLTIPNTTFDVDNISTIGLLTFEVTNTALGMSDKLTEGIYKFTYKIFSDVGTLYTTSCYVAQMCTICCCLSQKLKDIKACSNCSSAERSKKLNQYYDNYMLKEKINFLMACQDFTGAQSLIDYLSTYCGIQNCDSC